MVCKNCGTQNVKNEFLCEKCGQRLGEPSNNKSAGIENCGQTIKDGSIPNFV